ncbi:uncharacterized protein A1O9_00869 [Exophiala aquamarina CBS 119918]|uniref:Alcohol dehydrogenase-like C-terminal domain-containing protein n=1 Tax=Exophiala aquamarina CBS 119918 TaxID=1182545 RepID=A0A072Q4R1_9EURO|nr:uncharacterized protein A1O9_00869 [Exophiala aquamarina CBS 119918]KEF62895.1 hypothetical protein A1O9_00869 [Exophiala aquamarina CBS 119918]
MSLEFLPPLPEPKFVSIFSALPMSSSTKNRGLWLESHAEHPKLVDLPVPKAGAGSVVVRVLATWLPPYTAGIHDGTLSVFNLFLPLVPNPSNVGRIHEIGPDAVSLKVGDLVYTTAWIKARDDPEITILQGHHGGEGPGGAKLMQGEWRDGAMQQFQKVPLENVFVLDETRLCHELGYSAAELMELPVHTMAYGALCEAGNLQPGETVIIGPATGTFGPASVELALASGANVVALGRNKAKLEGLKEQLHDHSRLRCVVMTGDVKEDADAIIDATPSKRGAELFNDWSSATLMDPPYLQAAIRALKSEGRVVLSGAPSGNINAPYAYTMHKNIRIIGKMMCDRRGIQSTIELISSGYFKVGSKAGAVTSTFTLDQHDEAFRYAAEKGGWKNYTFMTPNSE